MIYKKDVLVNVCDDVEKYKSNDPTMTLFSAIGKFDKSFYEKKTFREAMKKAIQRLLVS